LTEADKYVNYSGPSIRGMRMKSRRPVGLDDVDRALLRILAQNARQPAKSIVALLARSGIRMSERGVAKRIKKLEDTRVIQGYTIVVNGERLGEMRYRVVLIRFKTTTAFGRRIADFKRYLTEAPFCMLGGRARGDLDWINFKVFPSREAADLESDVYRSCFGDIIDDYRAYDLVPIEHENHTGPMLMTEKELQLFLRKWQRICKIA